MKRDMELFHKILLALEEKGRVPAASKGLVLENYDETTVQYHLMLLADTELVQAVPNRHNNAISYFRLTNQGHEFVEAIGDNTPWKRAKERSAAVIMTVLKTILDKGLDLGWEELRRLTGLP